MARLPLPVPQGREDDARNVGLSERLAGQLLEAAIDRGLLFVDEKKSGKKTGISNVGPAAEKPRRGRPPKGKKT